MRKINCKEALPFAIKEALAVSREPGVIIEQFTSGREICADCYVQNGIVHMISIYEKFNLFQEQTVIQCFRSLRPAKIPPQTERDLHKIIQRIAYGFNLKNTPLFIQTLLTPYQIEVIEFAARAPGGLAYLATELSTRFDMVKAGISSFLNETVVIPTTIHSPHYYSTNSIYGKPGTFSHVTGYKELLKTGVIKKYSPYKTKGMAMGSSLSSQDRVAGFIIEACTKSELFAKTKQALAHLNVYNTAHESVMLKAPFLDVQDSHIFCEEPLFEVKAKPYAISE